MTDKIKLDSKFLKATFSMETLEGRKNLPASINGLGNWLTSNISDELSTNPNRMSSLIGSVSKDSIVRLKYIKKKAESSSKPTKQLEQLPATFRKFALEEKPAAITDSTKATRQPIKLVYRSPEKMPEKFQSSRKLLRFAEKHGRKKPSQSKPMPRPNGDKNAIIQNLYFKNQSYFYSNKIDLKTLIRSVYYQGQQIEQLKDFLLPTFKKIGSNQSYFETIFEEAKCFSETVKKFASRKISRLLESNGTFKVTGGIEDLLQSNFFTEDLKTLMRKSASYKFRSFSSASRGYIDVIKLLYEQYKHLEQVNLEIEKLTHIYLNNYLNDGVSIDFDTFNFHSRMFVACVYNDRLIHEFILFIYKTLKNSTFYQGHYPRICQMVFEIYDNFEQNIIASNEKKVKTSATGNPVFDTSITSTGTEAWLPTVETNSSIGEVVTNDNTLKDYFNKKDNQVSKKTKKKKRNKKKAKTEVQIEEAINEDNSEVVQEVEHPWLNEDTPEILKDIGLLESMFARVEDWLSPNLKSKVPELSPTETELKS